MEPRKFILRTEFVRKNLLAFLSKVGLDPLVEVEVRLHQDKRSNAQNSRLWLLHGLAAKHTGYSAEEMHDHALCRFFGYDEREVIDPLTGEVERKRIPRERSSGQYRKRFGEFMESTEAWYISEFGVWLDREAA